MVIFEIPRRRCSARFLGICLGTVIPIAAADPAAMSPRFQVNFTNPSNGKIAESIAVPVPGDSIMVAVLAVGQNPADPQLLQGSRPVPVRVIGHDPVSRLQFLQVQGGAPTNSPEWLGDTADSANSSLIAMAASGPVKCRTTGWVKQVGGKILPLALLQVSFSGSVPPPGTPLMDDAGRVAGIIFQQAGGVDDTAYAIPAAAVRRVQRDVCSGSGQLVRGWLGLSLRSESTSPQVFRVLPGSPAAAVGIQPGDVLVSVGSRTITDYADAANAFFYLIPGQPVKVKLLRGADSLEYSLIPIKSAAK